MSGVCKFADRLPEEIRLFTTRGVYTDEGDSEHRSFVQGGGHGGPHPHLAHRLLQAVLGNESPFPNAVQAANITCAGILSHESALRGGDRVSLPDWTLSGDQPFVIPLDQVAEPAWVTATPLAGSKESPADAIKAR